MQEFDDIVAVATRQYLEYATGFLDSVDIATAIDLLEIARGQRPYMVSSAAMLESLWETIRESTVATQMILDLSTKWHLTLLTAGVDVGLFCSNFTEAFEICGRPLSTVDETIRDRAFAKKDQAILFRDNIWYVYLYLVGLSPEVALKLSKIKVE